METKVSDFFEPKFSYYNKLIDRPRTNAADRAKNLIFTALVRNDGNTTYDI